MSAAPRAMVAERPLVHRVATLERRLTDLVDRMTWHLGGRIEPVKITHRLAGGMHAGVAIHQGVVVAPNNYLVQLNEFDFARLSGYREALEIEFAQGLRALARQHQYAFVSEIKVRLCATPSLRRGTLRVLAAIETSLVAVAGASSDT